MIDDINTAEGFIMDEKIFRERLIELIVKKNVSEQKMSKDLGFHRTYIRNITSGKSLPLMKGFFKICDYLEITPAEFFTMEEQNQEMLDRINEEFMSLDKDSKVALKDVIKKLK